MFSARGGMAVNVRRQEFGLGGVGLIFFKKYFRWQWWGPQSYMVMILQVVLKMSADKRKDKRDENFMLNGKW